MSAFTSSFPPTLCYVRLRASPRAGSVEFFWHCLLSREGRHSHRKTTFRQESEGNLNDQGRVGLDSCPPCPHLNPTPEGLTRLHPSSHLPPLPSPPSWWCEASPSQLTPTPFLLLLRHACKHTSTNPRTGLRQKPHGPLATRLPVEMQSTVSVISEENTPRSHPWTLCVVATYPWAEGPVPWLELP